jgi:hypothetical protein
MERQREREQTRRAGAENERKRERERERDIECVDLSSTLSLSLVSCFILFKITLLHILLLLVMLNKKFIQVSHAILFLRIYNI